MPDIRLISLDHITNTDSHWITHLTPWDQMCLSLCSILTSSVPIIFLANFTWSHHKYRQTVNYSPDTLRPDVFESLFYPDIFCAHHFLGKFHLITSQIQTDSHWITHLTPWDQMCLLSLCSILTSSVPIIFLANLRISLMARGARLLKPLQKKNIKN